MTRAEKVQRAQELRAEGLKLREIAERMNSKVTTVHTWLADPDLSKQRARREGYRGKCQDCGSFTDGSNGAAAAPARCRACAAKANARWDRDRIVAAAQEFARRYGRQPRATDWHPQDKKASPEQSERFYRDGCWPQWVVVQYHWGTWNALIKAAGFETFDQRRDHDWGPGRLTKGRAVSEQVAA